MGDAFPSLGALTELASEQKPLMDAIDELRRYQIDKIVDLPQIIVIGDQSSGKSSVLAAISKIQFPAKGSVCTRFAIELVLRTSSRSTLGAHIHRTNGSITELRAVADTNFDGGLLANIIEDAGKKMRTLSGFSEDVLRVEICRPDVPHLTLIDLPGFYHSENEEQSAEGRLLVERLADKYMARDTSIILAIVAASNDVILQSVLSKVRQHDKGGRRTLGIVTKPDLLLAGSRGEMMVQLARNTQPSHKLELGWHVLRNRDENEIDDLDDTRDEKESELLSRAPWNTLRSADRGVARLRTKLSNILLRHIQQSLPDLDANIRGKLDEYEARLKSLGEPRARPADLRAFLDRVASRYQTICSHALEGNYSDDFFGGLYPDDEQDERTRKLRALVRDLNRAFAYILGRKGARRRVVHPDDPTGPADSDNASEASYASSSGESTDSTTEAPAFIGGWEIHATGEIQRLTQAYNFADPEVIPVSRMARELDLLASRNQGNELPGTSNDALALNLFRDQISPWAKIADFHVQHVTWFAKAFVEKLMSHIIADDDEAPYRAILQHRVDPFFEARAVELKAKVRELLFHYQHGHPQPYDAEFQTLFTDARRPQTTNAAIAVLKDMPWLLSEEGKSVLATASQAASKTKANKQPNPASLDVIAKCQTYYQISIYSFINNVIILAVENCLIRKLPSVMTTEMVSQMEDEELCLLASESSSAQLDRAELQKDHEALTRAAKALKPFRLRNSSFMPAMFGSEETKARSETPTSTRHLPNSDDDDDGDDDEPEFGDESCSEDSDHPSEPFTPEPKVTLRTRKIHVRLPTDPKQRLSPVIESDARRGAAGAGARQTPPEKRPSHGASARRDPVVVPIDSPEPPPAPAFDYSVPEPRPSFVTKELAQLSRDLDELSTSLGIEKPHSANPVHQPGADSSRDLDHTTARPPSRPSGAPKHVAHPASSSTRMFNFD